MKRVLIIAFVVTLVAGGFLFLKPWRLTSSWMAGCGTHVARNHQDAEAFLGRFDTWLAEHDFVPADKPADSHAGAGVQRSGDKHFWYSGSYEGFEPVYLHLRKNERPDVGGGWTDFHFYTSWFVRGSGNHLIEARVACDKLVAEFSDFAAQGLAHIE